MAVSAAVFAIASTRNRFSFFLITYHTPYDQSYHARQYEPHNYCSQNNPPFQTACIPPGCRLICITGKQKQ